MNLHYFATTFTRFESITAKELEGLGGQDIRIGSGGVFFSGPLEILYKANLHLRTANRILVLLKKFSARTPEMLYDQVRRIKWETILTPEMTFALDAMVSGKAWPKMQNPQFIALKIKDAIADQMRFKCGERPNVDRDNPSVKIAAFLENGECWLSLDSSGARLHERGYRSQQQEAPIKETLAALLVELSGWDPSTHLIDPMCGAGTIPIEALLKALGYPPGLLRKRFGFSYWKNFDASAWESVKRTAEAQLETNIQQMDRHGKRIYGFDQSSRAIRIALQNYQKLGLPSLIHFEKKSFETLNPQDFALQKAGTLLLNPPYGERLGEEPELETLYQNIGSSLKHRFKGWSAWIFTGNRELLKHVGLKSKIKIPMKNGPIETRFVNYELF